MWGDRDPRIDGWRRCRVTYDLPRVDTFETQNSDRLSTESRLDRWSSWADSLQGKQRLATAGSTRLRVVSPLRHHNLAARAGADARRHCAIQGTRIRKT